VQIKIVLNDVSLPQSDFIIIFRKSISKKGIGEHSKEAQDIIFTASKPQCLLAAWFD